MKDKTIVCCQCEASFLFSASEQERSLKHGFGEPKRCPACRRNKAKEVEVENCKKIRGRKKIYSKKDSMDLDNDW